MRLLTLTSTNVHTAVQTVNELVLAGNVVTMYPQGQHTVTVLRATDYPDYCHLCKKLGQTPVSTKEYFK